MSGTKEQVAKSVTVTVAPGRSIVQAVPGGVKTIKDYMGKDAAGNAVMVERVVSSKQVTILPGKTAEVTEAEAKHLLSIGHILPYEA
jgi:hypothetical protein